MERSAAKTANERPGTEQEITEGVQLAGGVAHVLARAVLERKTRLRGRAAVRTA